MKFNCLKCGLLTGRQGFASHLRSKHSITQQEYYDEFLKKENEGKCLLCKSETKFRNSFLGYFECCSLRCTAIIRRQRFKENPEKFEIFTQKVKTNMEKEWKKDQSKRIQKSSEKLKRNISVLTEEERKQKYDSFSKLSDFEKKERIKKMCFDKGFCKWWKEATYEQKTKVYLKSIETQNKNRKPMTEEDYINLLNSDIFQKVNNSLSSFFEVTPI